MFQDKIPQKAKPYQSQIQSGLTVNQTDYHFNDLLNVCVKKRWPCLIRGCDKSYARKSSRNLHQKNVHSGQVKHKCKFPNCEKLFSEKGNLRAHMRIHTGEKPFHCSECDMTFTFVGNCRDHERRHYQTKQFLKNNNSHYRPHSCLLCSKKYYRKYQLKSHIRIKHDIGRIIEKNSQNDSMHASGTQENINKLDIDSSNIQTFFKCQGSSAYKGCSPSQEHDYINCQQEMIQMNSPENSIQFLQNAQETSFQFLSENFQSSNQKNMIDNGKISMIQQQMIKFENQQKFTNQQEILGIETLSQRIENDPVQKLNSMNFHFQDSDLSFNHFFNEMQNVNEYQNQGYCSIQAYHRKKFQQ